MRGPFLGYKKAKKRKIADRDRKYKIFNKKKRKINLKVKNGTINGNIRKFKTWFYYSNSVTYKLYILALSNVEC